MPKKIGVITTTRADYGIYRPILRRLQADDAFELDIYATGMHVSPMYGSTIRLIREDGFHIAAELDTLVAGDSPQAVSKAMGLTLMSFGQLFAAQRPDILLTLGDRFEMYAAALAALPFSIVTAHIHGGEVTRGAIDDVLRHALTKLAHLHFASTRPYARRIIQLGEDPARVFVSGAPSLENLRDVDILAVDTLKARFGLGFERPPLLVTYHPVTTEHKDTSYQIDQLLAALERAALPVVFTMPNADTANRIIFERIQQWVAAHADADIVESFGTQGYFSMMTHAAAMVGNSSSGIIEAASFKLPVVNIGTRQDGRVQPGNVVQCGYPAEDIHRAIQRACSAAFRREIADLDNPYVAARPASEIIRRELLRAGPFQAKAFYDVDLPEDLP